MRGPTYLGVALGLLVYGSLAHAENKSAAQWFSEGENYYNVGDFAKAIVALKKAYEVESDEGKKPAYIYNIAQAYRQLRDCRNAVFFYKRFLALKADDRAKPIKPALRSEIEKRIEELEPCAKRQEADAQRLAEAQAKPKPTPEPPIEKKPPTPEPDEPNPDEEPDERPRQVGGPAFNEALVMRLYGGLGLQNLPSTPSALLVGLDAATPLKLGEALSLELGANLTYAPTKYTTIDTKSTAKGGQVTVGAMVAVRYRVADSVDLRAQLGLGALVLTGVATGSPYTVGGAGTSGALTMFNGSIGVGASYWFHKHVGLTLDGTFRYSPPKTGFIPQITKITRVDVSGGIAFRF